MSGDNGSVAAPAVAPAVPRLGQLAARGALRTMGGQACKILLQFGGIVVLARLLSPGDYGLLAMVAAIVGVGEVLRDFGLSSAAVQARSVSVRQRSNLFWINAGIGLLLALAVAAAAPAIAAFYAQPALQPIAQALAPTFLINGLATQYRAQLNRDMRFGRLAVADVGGQAFGLAAGVTLALRGHGHWALVAQQLVQACATLLLLVATTGWRPGLPRRDAAMGEFLRYGGNLMSTQLVVYLSRNIDALIIGQRFGAELLGLYNRAAQLLALPLNQLNAPATSIALPVLSRLRDDPARYDRFLLHGQSVMLHVTVAVFAFAGAQAEPLILLVLGPQWAPAVPIFQILAIGGVFQAASQASYWVFLSKGLTASNLRFTLVSRLLLIAAIVFGAQWGAQGVAAAFAVGVALGWLGGLVWLRASGAPVGAMGRNGLRVMFAYGLCGLVSAATALQWGGSLVGRLALGTAAMLAAFLLLVALWPAFRRSLMDILRSRSLLRAG
ncbi:lipopolysaccharide biosynthesis protein [Aromatoleum petrolei]|uniref:Oligosaccharide flippase family protein n=1 Tax=Aromatoleum petrolei TaxID=76116 RepID=A0ABX1MGI0_9RHOO|nr:lipopolysaccharide biosynthesis protein [Aromatoleum petrolei]NMF87005.1 oligosaccharide flippase family protein [Aromatoleum petrolei]QTQ37600.1 Putative polysaccharide biosynthesis protein [Aromatoleum petrolei]